MKKLSVYQIFLIFILLFITLCVYLSILDAGYAPTDDWLMLRSYSGSLKKISLAYIVNTFKNFHEGLYHPLVTLSYTLEVNLFGFIPAVFHLDNILLHLINIYLVFLIFFKLSKNNYWVGFIVAILFALHPTRVEAVAWISARKDLLYAPFYLLSILFYLKHNENSDSHSIFSVYMYISVLFFLLSCFAKSMAITLPFFLILIDLYTNKFNKKKIKWYSIFFLIALIFVFLTFVSHYNTITFDSNERLQLTFFKTCVNFINAHFNIIFYLDKFLLPINLYCLYPIFYEETLYMPPWFIMYSPLVLYLMILLICLSLKKTKVVFFGFMFFLVTIAPVSGVFPIGDFAVADRYTYLPYLGLFYIFAKFIVFLSYKYNNLIKAITICFCILIEGTFGYLSYNRVIDWKTNHYGPPIKMKYYEFGITKKTEKESIIIPKQQETYKRHVKIGIRK